VVLGLRGRRSRPESGDLAGGLGRGSGWGGSRVHEGTVWVLLALERRPATTVGGAGRRAPLGALLRRAGQQVASAASVDPNEGA
jgi:hypothetical protein